MATSPLSGLTRPSSISRRVDFPDPFGPITPIRSASETVNEIFWNSGRAPYLFDSPCALIIGGKFLSLLPDLVYPRGEPQRKPAKGLPQARASLDPQV